MPRYVHRRTEPPGRSRTPSCGNPGKITLIVCRRRRTESARSVRVVEEEPLRTALGAAVRSRRRALEWSQEELAQRAGLHRNYVGGVERGERNLSLSNIAAIAQALEVPPSILL